VASFLRDSNAVTVLLGQGHVSLFHGENTMPVRVKVGDIFVLPLSGPATLGEVSVSNGVVTVTARDGMLRVERNGQAIEVAKGETITMPERASTLQALKGSSLPRPPFLPLQSTPHPSPPPMRETNPPQTSLTTSPIALADEATAKTDASRTALDATAAPMAPVITLPSADMIGRALNPLADRRRKPSHHEPHW